MTSSISASIFCSFCLRMSSNVVMSSMESGRVAALTRCFCICKTVFSDGISSMEMPSCSQAAWWTSSALMAWNRSLTNCGNGMPPVISVICCCCSSSSCLFKRARRAANELMLSLSNAPPKTTAFPKSEKLTERLVSNCWLAVLSDLVTPMASTIT